MSRCVIDGACITCDAVPEQPAVPGHTNISSLLGWRGANSISMLDGDLHVTDTAPSIGALGAIVGFKPGRYGQSIPALATHALYFTTVAGIGFVSGVEYGSQTFAPRVYADGDTFEIRRAHGIVSYWLNSDRLFESTLRSYGPLVVNGVVFAIGDIVP